MSQHQKTNTLSHLFPFHSLSEPLSRPLGTGREKEAGSSLRNKTKSVKFSFSGDLSLF